MSKGPDVGALGLLGSSGRLGVDWTALARKHGFGASRGRPDFIDLYGGIEALVLEDNLSAGVGIDMSALVNAETLKDSVVYNGTIAPQHDLGNAFVYANFDANDDLLLFFGVERLESEVETWIEIELNQDRVGVTGGVPWPIRGARTVGDLLVRVAYLQGSIASVEVERWEADDEGSLGFMELVSYEGLTTTACGGEPSLVLFCTAEPKLSASQELWDAAGNPVEPIAPDNMLEVGVNTGRLLGTFVEYSAIQIKTPQDVILGSFKTTGYWARSLDRAE